MRGNRPLTALIFLLALPLFGAALVALPRVSRLSEREGLIYVTESLYQNLYVTRDAGVLTLRAGSLNVRSSALDLSDPLHLVLEYTELMMLGLGYVEDPREILILGLGGGTLTRYLRHYYPEAQITSVEIDDAVVAIARDYFSLEEGPRNRVVVDDARRFLARAPDTYDLIFLDAYHGDYIPFHLLTREFLELVQQRLRTGGAVVANTWSDQQLYERESATYAAVFGAFDSYLGELTSNRIIVANREGRGFAHSELLQRMATVQRQRRFSELVLSDLLERHFDRDLHWPEDTPVLVDDHAPVNFLVRPERR